MTKVEEWFGEGFNADRVRHALSEHSERVGGLGSWAWDLSTGRMMWSENMFRLLGFERGQVDPSPATMLSRVHPEDRDALANTFGLIQTGGALPRRVYRYIVGGGQVRHLHAAVTVSTSTAEGGTLIVGVSRDVTADREAEREIAAHLAVTRVLSGWQDLDRSGQLLLAEHARVLVDFSATRYGGPTAARLRPEIATNAATGEVRDSAKGTQRSRTTSITLRPYTPRGGFAPVAGATRPWSCRCRW